MNTGFLSEYLRKPVALALVIGAIALAGAGAATQLPVKMYPDMVKPSFEVSFGHFDVLQPEELYKAYGRQIEDRIRALEGVERVSSTYSRGRARIAIDCIWDVDEKNFKRDLEEILTPFNTGSNRRFWHWVWSRSEQSSAGSMMIAVSSDRMNAAQLRTFLEQGFQARLEKIDGVKRANFWGWAGENLVLEVDRNRLLNFRLGVSDLEAALQSAFQAVSAGTLTSRPNEEGMSITIPAPASALDEVLNLPVSVGGRPQSAAAATGSGGATIRLGDVARIETIHTESAGLFRLNGKEANYLNVSLDADGDVKRACEAVEKALSELKASTPGMDFNILVNPAVFVGRAISNLAVNAVLGGLVAILVIYLFLGAFRNTLIIALSIPFCVVSAFIFMWAFGVSINIISLGGMAIGVGMIVDSSIVALENIHRRLTEAGDTLRDRASAILSATGEIALPVTASVLTSVVVFFPLVFTKSYTQAILGDLARTVVFVLVTSVFSALVIVPGLSYRLIRLPETPTNPERISVPGRVARLSSALTAWLSVRYAASLRRMLATRRSPLLVLGACAILLGSALALLPRIEREIIAVPSTELLDISVRFPDNDDLELARRHANRLEEFLAGESGVLSYSTYFWSPQGGYITATLRDRDLFAELEKRIQERFEPTPEFVVTPQKWDPGAMPLPRKRDLQINVKGADNDAMTAFSDRIMALAGEHSAHMYREPWVSKADDLVVRFRETVAGRGELQKYIEAAGTKGRYVTDVFEEGRARGLSIIFRESQRVRFAEDLRLLPVLHSGRIVPLKALADVSASEQSYIPLHFVDGTRMQEIFVQFNSKKTGAGGTDAESGKQADLEKKEAARRLTEAVGALARPIEIALDFPDTNAEINRAYESFAVALGTAVLLVFLVIALMFNSLKYPLIILAAIPLSLIGIIAGLFVTSSTVSLNSMLGTILLAGLVVNNAILMIDFYLRALRERRQDAIAASGPEAGIEAIVEAGSLRLRPILMTTFTTLLGVLPIALAFGESGEILQPLGIAVFGGLLVSTVLSLFGIPAFLRLVDHWGAK